MPDLTVEQALLLGAFVLLAGGQASLWWRSGTAAPQSTALGVLTQSAALGVLALGLADSGRGRLAAGLMVFASTGVLGLVSAARTVARQARASGTSWVRAHRDGLRTVLHGIEALVAVVAVLAAASWGFDRFAGDFDGKADAGLCRLLDGNC